MIEYETSKLHQIGESFLPGIKELVEAFSYNQIIEFQNDYSLGVTVLIHTDHTVFDYFREVT
jgi:hypothetical protein